MNYLMKLWLNWIAWTGKRAQAKSDQDVVAYGIGFLHRRWWGFRRLNPYDVTIRRMS